MHNKTLISKSTLAAVLTGTALTLGSAGVVVAQTADDADQPDQMQQEDNANDMSSNDAGLSDSADTAAEGEDGFITQQASSQTLAKDVIGISLRDGTGDDANEIGKVTDLILDENDKLDGVVVGVGGFLGMGQKDVGIPWSKIEEVDAENKTAVTNLTKDELKDAPEFVTAEQQKREEEAQRQMDENATQAPAGGAPAPAAPTE